MKQSGSIARDFHGELQTFPYIDTIQYQNNFTIISLTIGEVVYNLVLKYLQFSPFTLQLSKSSYLELNNASQLVYCNYLLGQVDMKSIHQVFVAKNLHLTQVLLDIYCLNLGKFQTFLPAPLNCLPT